MEENETREDIKEIKIRLDKIERALSNIAFIIGVARDQIENDNSLFMRVKKLEEHRKNMNWLSVLKIIKEAIINIIFMAGIIYAISHGEALTQMLTR